MWMLYGCGGEREAIVVRPAYWLAPPLLSRIGVGFIWGNRPVTDHTQPVTTHEAVDKYKLGALLSLVTSMHADAPRASGQSKKLGMHINERKAQRDRLD